MRERLCWGKKLVWCLVQYKFSESKVKYPVMSEFRRIQLCKTSSAEEVSYGHKSSRHNQTVTFILSYIPVQELEDLFLNHWLGSQIWLLCIWRLCSPQLLPRMGALCMSRLSPVFSPSLDLLDPVCYLHPPCGSLLHSLPPSLGTLVFCFPPWSLLIQHVLLLGEDKQWQNWKKKNT